MLYNSIQTFIAAIQSKTLRLGDELDMSKREGCIPPLLLQALSMHLSAESCPRGLGINLSCPKKEFEISKDGFDMFFRGLATVNPPEDLYLNFSKNAHDKSDKFSSIIWYFLHNKQNRASKGFSLVLDNCYLDESFANEFFPIIKECLYPENFRLSLMDNFFGNSGWYFFSTSIGHKQKGWLFVNLGMSYNPDVKFKSNFINSQHVAYALRESKGKLCLTLAIERDANATQEYRSDEHIPGEWRGFPDSQYYANWQNKLDKLSEILAKGQFPNHLRLRVSFRNNDKENARYIERNIKKLTIPKFLAVQTFFDDIDAEIEAYLDSLIGKYCTELSGYRRKSITIREEIEREELYKSFPLYDLHAVSAMENAREKQRLAPILKKFISNATRGAVQRIHHAKQMRLERIRDDLRQEAKKADPLTQECYICLEIYNVKEENRRLIFPCAHLICQSCFKNLAYQDYDHSKDMIVEIAACPTCRQKGTAVPTEK